MAQVAQGPTPTPHPLPFGPQGQSSKRESRRTTVFRAFRRLLEALEHIAGHLQALHVAVGALIRVQDERGPAVERLELLELSRHQWEAMCEGLLQKAEGKLRAANNAEARERANKKSYEHLLDPLAEEGVEPEAPGRNADRGDDVAHSEAERLSAMRLDVAPSPKQLAQRAKWGVS